MSYNAMIAKLENVRIHPNADRLKLANCLGSQVIVGLEAKDGDIVVYFPDDGQVSHEYAFFNNLYNKPEMNKDPDAKCGFFDNRRRVRCQTFRGEKSEAYVTSLESLSFANKVDGINPLKLQVGDKFDSLNGFPICNKYITDATRDAGYKNKGQIPIQSGYNKAQLKKLFPEHIDTDQFRFAQDSQLTGIITLMGKLHGTSAATGNLYWPIEQETKWYQNLWNIFVDEVLYGPKHIFNFFLSDEQKFNLKLYPEEKKEWQIIQRSRRVIKGQVKDKNTDFRSNCSRILVPHIKKGEMWYYEIVGYEDGGAPIMQPVDLSNLQSIVGKQIKDKLIKRFGSKMIYKYGCLPGTCEIYVYRIIHQNEDGFIYELPWEQVKGKCNKAGIKHVPEIARYIVDEGLMVMDSNISKYDDDWRDLKEIVEYYTENIDIAEPIDASHLREGICIRRDSLEDGSMKIWKNKTWEFKVTEGIAKDSDTYVDEEESQGLGDTEELESIGGENE